MSGETAARTCAVISMSTAVTPGSAATTAARLLAHLVLDRTGRRRQLDGERHAPAVDAQVLDEFQGDDVAVEVGIVDRLSASRTALDSTVAMNPSLACGRAPDKATSSAYGAPLSAAG